MTTREERRRAEIEARRARRRPKRKTARSRLFISIGATVVVVVAGLIAFDRWRGDDDAGPEKIESVNPGRGGSRVIAGAPPVEIVRTPTSFRAVYLLENEGRKAISQSTDKVFVRRPFESRLELWSGKPPGGKQESFQVGRFAKRVTQSGDSPPTGLHLPIAIPPSDIRLLPVLSAALDQRLLERREVREIAGRLCQVYRSAEYLSASVLKPPTKNDYADSCVDEAGILLEEVLVSDGDILSRRIAVEVEEDPALSDELFPDAESAIPASSGGGLVRRLKAGSMPPGDFLLLDTPPLGFEYLGRWSVIPPQADNFSDPTREGSRRAGISDVWVRGIDVLIVDQGGTLRGEPPFTADEDAPQVDLGTFGRGEQRLSAVSNEVRVLLEGGRYLRIAGTLAPDDLVNVAQSLRTVPGGTLEFEEPPG